ncbi:thiol:disulfide interchange protein DsbA/DsbL [Janthinobacterium lividum]|uniref:thiol:disulfide interchange protein DsbA/DsbL n=1 Tax=Janthinobacterium lividum TaxID=29581 RepID=UPI00140B0D7F|nr:thiol:disulfide interchange protein DsbA/DsbL [Janthinobacterium lividum]NHQ93946.1 thiol:disulfide interchange protein DsbA/DsbL [Janthinobacterium lividum]
MRLHRLILACASFITGAVFASPQAPVQGADYLVLATPQPVQTAPGKVEVIEFFMYHCPACNALEPSLARWVKDNAATVSFRRIHLPRLPENDPEAHLFLTLEALKKEESLHAQVMHTWHVERKRLASDSDNLDWALKNGLDKAAFESAYQSFGVQTKLKNLPRLAASYQVDSTPTLIVGGRYLTNPSMVAGANPALPRQGVEQATLQVVQALVAKAKLAK